MYVADFFTKLAKRIQNGGCPGFVQPTDDWCALAYSSAKSIEASRIEEALLWTADATFGRQNLLIHSGDNPEKVYAQMYLIFEQCRMDFSLYTADQRMQLWQDLYAALCFGWGCRTQEDFMALAPRRSGSIFERYAFRKTHKVA